MVMDDLPSYEAATSRNPWMLIAPYLSSQQLCSAALVCREWNMVFTPQLWKSPASHFGYENDLVFVALTRFRRILPYARPCVRELTHTLRFPPAHAEIYAGPHAEWLRDCLEYLPHLQSLIVNGLPFFDHASLLCLRYPSQRMRSTFPMFGLRLLEASGCTNATSTGLAEALPHFPDLVSLDLSKTAAARGKAVLSALEYLPSLRVLSLRGIGLKDDDFSVVAHSTGKRVRSLDISDNYLTDVSTQHLLELCLKETAPVPQEHACSESEEARDVGISHLYLSANDITIEGICGLLRPGHLQVLDAGTLRASIRNSDEPSTVEQEVALPSVSKLTPILSEFACHRLQYIRINYQIVTEDVPLEVTPSPPVELSGGLGSWQPSGAQELAVTKSSIHELEPESNVIHEMPGDSSFAVELPGSIPSTRLSDHASLNTCAGDRGANASRSLAASDDLPLMVTERDQEKDQGPVLVDSPLSPHVADEMRSHENYSHHLEGLETKLEKRKSTERCLHPGMLPKLQTLVLTQVPIKAEKYVIDRIIEFIKNAADETLTARQRARLTYALPPGRRRVLAEEEYASSLFALRRIVLEMAAPQSTPKKLSTSWRQYPSKSSTEDPDSEAFWEAASSDFSFFGAEECGQPSSELVRTRPVAAGSGLELVTNQKHSLPEPKKPDTRLFDVVEEVGKFRRERKAAYDNLVASGETDAELEGYWPGVVTVVRKSLNPEAGQRDYYGNLYQSGCADVYMATLVMIRQFMCWQFSGFGVVKKTLPKLCLWLTLLFVPGSNPPLLAALSSLLQQTEPEARDVIFAGSPLEQTHKISSIKDSWRCTT
ncbi:uncharacterized protein yc1106_10016 [Curvularia clavata]|uniref:F-box domain-containing protein n=1 Tax=Curvularia clavata TaxID=95742 RepID=A0A9Q8ZIT0_CURCL|nr:uncharacterized protein yc1106_10016 [Curvularia clavata]